MNKPIDKPTNPRFSSGPCSKRPGWSSDVLSDAVLGYSHRGKAGKAKLEEVIELTRKLLDIPDNYRIGIVPASDTGAVEMALWSLLGERMVDIFAWESFSNTWLTDISKQLKIPHQSHTADYGEIADLSHYQAQNDCVFVYNGTTSGVCVPHLDWIAEDREGLTICDATSAVFSQPIDFTRLDVATWSWQKALGGEAAHGMMVLSPRAVRRLESYTPSWPLPKIFQLTKSGKLNEGIFQGATINTPSLLCVEDVLDSMKWLLSIGGQKAAQDISNKSLSIISQWVDKSSWVDFLAKTPETRSNTSVCLAITDSRFQKLSEHEQREKIQTLCDLLESEQVAYDIKSYKTAPIGLRLWTGATVEPDNVAKLLPWLDWGFTQLFND